MSALKKFVESAQQKAMEKPPMGQGALAAFVRQGFKEVGAALGKPLPDSIQIDEMGSLANRITPQEVFAAKNNLAPQKSLDIDMNR